MRLAGTTTSRVPTPPRGALANGLLNGLTWRAILVGLGFVLLLRPAFGAVGLLGSGVPHRERWAIAFFGIRGVGSAYYLAFAINKQDFEMPEVDTDRGESRPL